jgi:tetratricopeptide (TPR) repeat protein
MERRLLIAVFAVFAFVALFTACGGGSDPIENAKVLVDLGKYDKALEVLDAASMEDPKNVDVYLLKGRVYMGMGDLEEADGAFSDAIAVGGKSAAKMVDQTIIEHYENSFERLCPPDDRAEQRELAAAFESLEMLSSERPKISTLDWTLDFLEKQEEPDVLMYEATAEVFGDRLDIDREMVERKFLPAIERLLKRIEDGDQYERAASRLASHVTSEEGEAKLEKMVNKYMPDISQAKRTMADMRTLGTATEAFAVDHAYYPDARGIQSLQPLVQPTYIRTAPTTDGWGTEFKVVSESRRYMIISAGADKTFDTTYPNASASSGGGATQGFDRDIIFTNGSFAQYPAEVRTD